LDDLDIEMLSLSARGYYCSQIILRLALEAQGKEDPDLIRAAAGLARGSGSEAGTCGALTGATCLLALHAGKGQDSEEELDRFWPMLADLWEWFEAEMGQSGCGALLRDVAPQRGGCGAIVSETYAKAVSILIDHGFDPTEPRRG